MLFVHYPKCSTCKKAKAFLDDRGVKYKERHIVEENPSFDELKKWYEMSDYPLKRFFNTSGMRYRELGLKDKLAHMSEEEQLELLSTDGMLVRRPILVDGERVRVGFKEKEWEEMV